MRARQPRVPRRARPGRATSSRTSRCRATTASRAARATCRRGTARRSSGSRSTSAGRRVRRRRAVLRAACGEDVAKWDALVSPNAFSTAIFRRAFDYDGRDPRDGLSAQRPAELAAAAGERRERRARCARPRRTRRAPSCTRRPGATRGRSTSSSTSRRSARRFGDEPRAPPPPAPACAGAAARTCAGRRSTSPRIRDIRELYLAADVLVTDYSSAMFDFAVTRQADALLHVRPRRVPRRDARLLLRLRGRGARTAARDHGRGGRRARGPRRGRPRATRPPTTPSASASARSRTARRRARHRGVLRRAAGAPVELGEDPVRHRGPREALAQAPRGRPHPSALAVSGSASSSSAAASASGSVGSTTRPVTPSSTISGIAQRIGGDARQAVHHRLEEDDPERLVERRHHERRWRAGTSSTKASLARGGASIDPAGQRDARPAAATSIARRADDDELGLRALRSRTAGQARSSSRPPLRSKSRPTKRNRGGSHVRSPALGDLRKIACPRRPRTTFSGACPKSSMNVRRSHSLIVKITSVSS